MEVNKNPNVIVGQSAEHFEAVVDEWMKLEPWKGMERSEARRIIAGLGILGARRMPEGGDVWQEQFSAADIEEAKRLCDAAEAQGRFPFGIAIPRL